jgi:hypothetical protein
MISTVKKVANAYNKIGFGGVVVRVLHRFGFYEPEILAARRKTTDLVRKLHNDVIAYGAFSGMILSNSIWWGRFDFANKILGTYETQVIDKLVELARPGATFIDVGCADGFFAVGILRICDLEKAVCFEISQEGRDVTAENAKRNAVLDRIDIRGQADREEITHAAELAAEAIVLCDIEGGEFSLFDDALLTKLSGSSIIIELHPHLIDDGYAKRDALIYRAGQYFNTSVMRRKPVSVGDFAELERLNDNERMLAFSEGRGAAGSWLVLTP